MSQTIDRRGLLKAFLGATLVGTCLKALPPSDPTLFPLSGPPVSESTFRITLTVGLCPYCPYAFLDVLLCGAVGDIVLLTGAHTFGPPDGCYHIVSVKRPEVTLERVGNVMVRPLVMPPHTPPGKSADRAARIGGRIVNDYCGRREVEFYRIDLRSCCRSDYTAFIES